MKQIDKFIIEKLHLNKDTKTTEKKVDDPTTWDVDDILVTIGGYNMILVDFYKIIKSTGKSFKVKELEKKNVSGNGWQGECVPVEDKFEKDAQEITCRINKWGDVKIDDHHARLWDGKPVHYDHMD